MTESSFLDKYFFGPESTTFIGWLLFMGFILFVVYVAIHIVPIKKKVLKAKDVFLSFVASAVSLVRHQLKQKLSSPTVES